MKKIIALLTSILMIFIFAGCGTGKTKSDSEYVKNKGKLVIGMTDFNPMDYKEKGSDKWIGFDADMATAFAKSLGVDAEFVVLADWGGKIMELNSKSIDCVWNGMTKNSEVESGMSISNAYCENAQVVVVPKEKADEYKTVDSIKGLSFAAESGSAGEKALKSLGCKVTGLPAQSDALMEVAAGTSQACAIDKIMAGAMIGEGTSYDKLSYTVSLEPEEYVVGFRKGSDLTEKLNKFFKDKYSDGTLQKVATTYGVQEAIIEQK